MNDQIGVSIDGYQYCLECAEPSDLIAGLPINIGDPAWGHGSVPICCTCRQEINTIPDEPEES
jgi:hypothetical protein